MEFTFSKKSGMFHAGIFAVLYEKKEELLKLGK